jgi:hypothetical protein
MKRTVAKQNMDGKSPIIRIPEQPQKIALELFSSEAFLVVNKRLLKKVGPLRAIFICNLIDKYKYFLERNMLQEDGSFFLTYEDQMEQTGMSEYQLRSFKNYFIDKEILKTIKKGIPAKEFYFLDLNRLLQFFLQGEEGSVQGLYPEKFKVYTLKNSGNIKDTIYKENKYNNKNIYLEKSVEANPIEEKVNYSNIDPITRNCRRIYNRWIEKCSHIHKAKYTPTLEKKMKSKLEVWSISKIMKAISHYAEIYDSPSYYKHKWTLLSFLSQSNGAPRFVSGLDEKYDGDLWDNHQRERPSQNKRPISAAFPKTAPKELIKKALNGLAPAFERSCYQPAKEILPGVDKGKLAQALIDLYEDIKEQQEKFIPPELNKLMPDPISLIQSYAEWIENNDWITDRSVNLFSIQHTLFHRFRREEAKKDNMERDPLTGKSYLRE